jgi:LysM repeat protein
VKRFAIEVEDLKKAFKLMVAAAHANNQTTEMKRLVATMEAAQDSLDNQVVSSSSSSSSSSDHHRIIIGGGGGGGTTKAQGDPKSQRGRRRL